MHIHQFANKHYDGNNNLTVGDSSELRSQKPRQLIELSGLFRICGTPCRIRTCDHILRRDVLYPAELRARYRAGLYELARPTQDLLLTFCSECLKKGQRMAPRSKTPRSKRLLIDVHQIFCDNTPRITRHSISEGKS